MKKLAHLFLCGSCDSAVCAICRINVAIYSGEWHKNGRRERLYWDDDSTCLQQQYCDGPTCFITTLSPSSILFISLCGSFVEHGAETFCNHSHLSRLIHHRYRQQVEKWGVLNVGLSLWLRRSACVSPIRQAAFRVQVKGSLSQLDA